MRGSWRPRETLGTGGTATNSWVLGQVTSTAQHQGLHQLKEVVDNPPLLFKEHNRIPLFFFFL